MTKDVNTCVMRMCMYIYIFHGDNTFDSPGYEKNKLKVLLCLGINAYIYSALRTVGKMPFGCGHVDPMQIVTHIV